MARHENKYLAFDLGEECYAIPIMKVKEILSIVDITRIPKMPSFLKGVINLRDKVIPVMDLRVKFSLDEKEYDEKTAIIIVEMKNGDSTILSGIIVDNVEEVIDITPSDIEPPPQYGAGMDSFLIGIGKTGDQVVMIINVSKILSSNELDTLENI